MIELSSFHYDLEQAKKLVYDHCNLDFTNLKINSESKEYGACTFELNNKKILFRVAKITPTKVGQFVTIWKRNTAGITVPFEYNDTIDFIIISTRFEKHFGQFIFPKQILIDKGIISKKDKIGKRGIRVYPPWDKVESKQAEKTQSWQTDYFLTIESDTTTQFEFAEKSFFNLQQSVAFLLTNSV